MTEYEDIKIGKNNPSSLLEKSNNLILRRTDWRFLISNPYPTKSICFTSGILADAVKKISKSSVNSALPYISDDCDLAVGTNPDGKTLEAAWSALRPGGCCYLEWDAYPHFRSDSVRKKLVEAKFEDIKFYLPKPAPSDSPPAIWIPIDEPAAINYLIRTSYLDKTSPPLKRAAIFLRYLLWLMYPKLFVIYPWLFSSNIKKFTISSIAYKPTNSTPDNQSKIAGEDKRHTRSESNIFAHITSIYNLEHKYKGPEPHTKSQTTSTLMLTKRGNILNKIIVLVFIGSDCQPSTVVKLPRTKESASALANEVKTLQTLEARFKKVNGIPRVIFHDQELEFVISGETFVSGVPISKIIKKNNCRDIALKTTSWLTEFTEATKTSYHENLWDYKIEPLLSKFIASFSTVAEPKLIKQTEEILTKLDLPYLVCEHRDFCPENILIQSDQEIGVIDWEGSDLSGLPGVDLIYFLINLTFCIENVWDSHKLRECYRAMLNPNSLVGKIFHECTRYYADLVSIPHTDILPLCLITSVIYSCLALEVKIINDGEPPNHNMLRENKFFILWEEVLRQYNKADIDGNTKH